MGFLPLPKSVTPETIVENTQVYGFDLDGEDMSISIVLGIRLKGKPGTFGGCDS